MLYHGKKVALCIVSCNFKGDKACIQPKVNTEHMLSVRFYILDVQK